MTMLLTILGWAAFYAAVVVGLGLDLVGLFGNWIILGAVGAAWALTGFERFGLVGLAIMAGLAALGEVLEAALAGYGATRFGGGKGSAVAALVGCVAGAVIGTPWLPVVGTVMGGCVGAFAGAALYEYIRMEKKVGAALWTGFGAALGRLAGQFSKVLVGVAMLIAAALTY